MSVKYYRDFVFMSPRDIWTGTTTSEIQFVDGDNGANGNAGWSPKKAVASITQAVTNVTAKRNAVIYVRPRGTAASAQTYYTDNITIPITCQGLSIIGAGSGLVRPFLGIDVKTAVSTTTLIDVKAAAVTLEGMRLTGTSQNTTDTIYTIKAFASTTSNGSVGLKVVNCRLDNGKTGGAIAFDSPNHSEIMGCSFDENYLSITSILSYGGVASRGLKIIDSDFGGRVAVRDMDIYISQSGAGNAAGIAGYEILRCRFLDGLPTKGSNNRFIKIANGDVGLIGGCYFCENAGGANAAAYGASGSQTIVPATWMMIDCHAGNGSSHIDPI